MFPSCRIFEIEVYLIDVLISPIIDLDAQAALTLQVFRRLLEVEETWHIKYVDSRYMNTTLNGHLVRSSTARVLF